MRAVADDRYNREESEEERLDRNLLELLERAAGRAAGRAGAVRVPADRARSRSASPSLTETQEKVYYVTLLATAASALLLIAPSAHHRINFRQQDKAYIVFLANRLTIAGLAFLAVAMSGVVWLITDLLYGSTATAVATAVTALAFAVLWYVVPIVRRMRRTD